MLHFNKGGNYCELHFNDGFCDNWGVVDKGYCSCPICDKKVD